MSPQESDLLLAIESQPSEDREQGKGDAQVKHPLEIPGGLNEKGPYIDPD
jgi:hypothetical protein